LRLVASEFGGARLQLLAIEAHTDHVGNAEANQIESYQRALTVRQYLTSVLKFTMEKVEAFGFGESDPLVPDFSPGHEDRNRRIVIKAIPMQDNGIDTAGVVTPASF